MIKSLLARPGRIILTLVATVAAIFVARGLWDYYMNEPWTRDARVRADVVEVAPDVAGLVDAIFVNDNSTVHRGDVLFRVDRERFEIALRQAEAVVAGRTSAVELAKHELERSENLKDYASRQRVEQADAALDQAKAALQQALADRDVAQLNLARSEVRASVNGVISNLSLQPGDYVSVGKAVMALINTDSLRVEGYFEETKISRIRVGDSATIHLMGRPGVLQGRVESIAGGIEDRERTAGALANINPTFTWVRLAQRIPVRIALDELPPDLKLVVGQTATVQIDGQPAPARR